MNRQFSAFASIVFLLMATPILAADTVTLNSGKVIEGKITKSDAASVTIDNGTGVGVSYYADEIKEVNGKSFVEQLEREPATVKRDVAESGQLLDEATKETFLNKVIYLKNQQFTSATCTLRVGSLDKYDQMLNMLADTMGGLFKIKINWDEYQVIISPKEPIQMKHPTISLIVEDKLKANISESGKNPDEVIQEYTQQYQQKLEASLSELDKGIIKVTTMILGNDKEFRVTNPMKMSDGTIKDDVTVDMAKAMGSLTGNQSNGQGMVVNVKQIFKPEGEQYQISQAAMGMTMPKIMEMKTDFSMTYQTVSGIRLPKTIEMEIDVKDLTGSRQPQHEKDRIEFDQCQITP